MEDDNEISEMKKNGKKGKTTLSFSAYNKNIETFDIQEYKDVCQCTSISFGQLPVPQQCYYCQNCDPLRSHKLCKFCYENCHKVCQEREKFSKFTEKKQVKTNIAILEFYCYCGINLKHKPISPEEKELIPCNMLILDQILGVKTLFCNTHTMQICCICSVTCHKSCDVVYETTDAAGRCNCKTDFHTNYNEIALTFPLNEYKKATHVEVWPIQILNILLGTKTVFQKMGELFANTLQGVGSNTHIDGSFFPLLKLFSNTLNRKFKTYYYDDELIRMFDYEEISKFLLNLGNDNEQMVLIKFSLIFFLLFIHLKRDFQLVKTLTSIDFLTMPILERLKFRTLLRTSNPLTADIINKYFPRGIKKSILMQVAIGEICNLIEAAMKFLTIEKNQNDYVIGLKYICFMLKYMMFDNDELERLTLCIYSFYDRFFDYLNSQRNNIYSLLELFNTLAEIFFLISTNYNDNVFRESLEKNGKLNKSEEVNGFVHQKSEFGIMIYKMILKSCDILKKHYLLLLKTENEKDLEKKKKDEAIMKMKIEQQNKIQAETTGVTIPLPKKGGIIIDKIKLLFNETLKLYSLADNSYFEHISNITKEDLDDFFDFQTQNRKGEYGNFFLLLKRKYTLETVPIYILKSNIERLVGKLFTGSYTNENLRIDYNIYNDILAFIKELNSYFDELLSLYKSNRIKLDKPKEESDLEENFCESVINKFSKFLPFLKNEVFPIVKKQFIESLILYNLDETITKILIFFSNRGYPHLLDFDLLEIITGILSIYMLTKNGMKYLLLGKNITRINKLIRRYSCRPDNKNIIPKYHRDLKKNLRYTEAGLKYLYLFTKGIKIYNLSIKRHKVLGRLNVNLSEHIDTLISSEEQNQQSRFQIISHLYLIIKIMNNLGEFFSYDDYEGVKYHYMNLFCTKLNLTENNAFNSLLSKHFRPSISRSGTLPLLTRHSSFTSNKNSTINQKNSIKEENEKNENENENEEKDDQISTNSKYDKTKTLPTLTLKLYMAFFSLVIKNTFFVITGSTEEKLAEKIFSFNDLSQLLKNLNINQTITLKEKTIILCFMRTFGFLNHIDTIDLFENKKLLSNDEYKTLIYNKTVTIDGVVSPEDANEKKDEEDVNEELEEKYATVNRIECIVDLYINELRLFPDQITSETKSAIILEYISEMITGSKFIADYFYFSKNLVNKLILKFYILTKELVSKSNLLISIYNKESEEHSDGNHQIEAPEENPKVEELKAKWFNIYEKDHIYRYMSEEIQRITKETNINESSALKNYLDTFDNMSEANFTPISLIETYDYEYFYEDDNNEDDSSEDEIQQKFNIIKEQYIAQFKNITNTSFYDVISTVSNEADRIDYRKKVVYYFISFLISTEANNIEQLEMLLTLIDKILFYDGDETQSKFEKMKKDKSFFPNINALIHKFIILTIISARNNSVFKMSMKMISVTKLLIQFLQLLGEGFNLDYHENIFKLQKDVGVEEYESEEESDSNEESEEEEREDEDNDIDNDDREENSDEQGSSKREHSVGSKKLDTNVLATQEDYADEIDESLYENLFMSLKRIYSLMDLSQEIASELPHDKLMVLTTNIIDFMIEYIDSADDNSRYINRAMRQIFFGTKYIKSDGPEKRIDKRPLLHPTIFTHLSVDDDNAQFIFRRKIICFIKIKYVQLLVTYLMTGKHFDFVIQLITRKCSPLDLFKEILRNFDQLIKNMKEINEDLYHKLIKDQSDDSFVNLLLNIYVYHKEFSEIIEFPLCLKLYILIKIFEDIYHQELLKKHFEKIFEAKANNKYFGDKLDNLDLSSKFSLRIYNFLEKIILSVEIKTPSEEDEDEEEENKGEKKNEDEEEDEPKVRQKAQLDTKLTFFVRPYITFRLTEYSKNNFQQNVNRESTTSKLMEMVSFADYSLLEMIANAHIIGTDKLKELLANFNYFQAELINYIFIVFENLSILVRYYRSPKIDLSFYDVADPDLINKLFPELFIAASLQLAFLGCVLMLYCYFRFALNFQHNLMKKYNMNFIFRKKGQSHSSNVTKTIMDYFSQEESMSIFTVLIEKNKDLPFYNILYVAIFDTLFLNREICIFLYSIIFISLYLKFHYELLLIFPTIFVCNITPTLLDIFRAMVMKFSSMTIVLVFIALVVYEYMWITYFYMAFLFDFDDIVEFSSGTEINESFCTSSIQCFLFMLQQGLRAGGGIGEVLPKMSFQTDPGFFIGRFFYDMLFYIFNIMILFNVFMSIIVDTFAELRDLNWSQENDMLNLCYICQLTRDDCLTKNIDFETHVKRDHLIWNYVYFLIHLHVNNANDFNGIENSVWEKLEAQDFGWVPMMKK